MSNQYLHNRQSALLRYMTNVDFIFGRISKEVCEEDPALRGIDIGRLRLEAEMTFEKRMGKIARVLPRTFSLFSNKARRNILEEFARNNKPRSYLRYEDARDFCEFLFTQKVSEPPYILDVARLELALAAAQISALSPSLEQSSVPNKPAIRRNRGVQLVHCYFDIRCFFEVSASKRVRPKAAAVSLLVIPNDARNPKIVELPRATAGKIEELNGWVALDCPDTKGALEASMVQRLVDMGALELTQ